MEFKHAARTQSKLHARPCAEIATKAQEYAEKHRVQIEIYNPHAEDSQADSAEGASITGIMLMALDIGSELEIIVRGDSTINVLQHVAYGMAEVISRDYSRPTSEILRP